MGLGPFDHPWLSGLFADEAMVAIWSAEKTLQHMLSFECAWSRSLGVAGLCDCTEAQAAAEAIECASIDLTSLHKGTARDGVPVPDLVAQLKKVTDSGAVHIGATSQDVVDTSLVLVLRDTSDLITRRLQDLIAQIDTLENRFGDASLMGRTRMQAATPITVRDRLQSWRLPLQSHCLRLENLRPTIEKVQIGGASGDRAALGNHAQTVVAEVAAALGLAPTQRCWHAMRDSVVEYASFLSLVSGTLGKMGQDVALMSQQGIEEIATIGGGNSSAMAHKQNPVLAELLITIARFNAVQVSGMHQAMVHEQERSGSAWSLEWMILPQMALATGRSLAAGSEICRSIIRLGG
ncbi:MAG: 3-carboxy-cis,cis-muconate cycloisomerase [Granulosicoccus sp.]